MKTFLIIILFIFSAKPIFCQNEEIIINHIGMLTADHHYFTDGGMGFLNLIIEECKTDSNTITLSGRLFDKESEEEVFFFNIYKAENDEINRFLNISDTLYQSPVSDTNKYSNRFSISTELKPTEGIYISIVGYGMIEIKIKSK